MIDTGHGGDDPGVQRNNPTERILWVDSAFAFGLIRGGLSRAASRPLKRGMPAYTVEVSLGREYDLRMRPGWLRFFRALRLSLLLPALIAFLGGSPAHAATWRVETDGSGDFLTVQAGINAAVDGDLVLVGPGTYRERIAFLGKDIEVRSTAGPEATILDGTGKSGSVVRFESGETRAAVLEGFTITGGTGEPTTGSFRNLWGGGISIGNSEATIRGNIVEGNTAKFYGGGLASGGSSMIGPIIESNTFRDNRAGTNGGGIAIEGGDIRDNSILDNECVDGDGGGVWAYTSEAVTISMEGNVISWNRAGDHGGGVYVALNADAGTSMIRENLISHNWAGGVATSNVSAGGGVWLYGGSQVLFANTVVLNESPGGASALGGGVAVERGSPRIERNIIALTVAGGGLYCDADTSPTILNNLAWSNAGGHSIGACVGWEFDDGNLVADPVFCGAEHDNFTVTRLSPALTHPAGPLGAYPEPGCDAVRVEATSWGRIKQLFR